MMDGVPSKVNVPLQVVSKSCVDFLIVLFMDCVQSWSISDCSWKVSNPESRHQNCKRIGLVQRIK